ncbi:hypothetical protein ELI_1339 [Eubacterium callanderi]|uniref:Uncharacterized protein n=1 Tax=Eubacterium callanderi TaxID=53442 RepID=E3GK30_9FIRM|nr:hypothetical protein ELI_1339 [Eubacterium callanderi]
MSGSLFLYLLREKSYRCVLSGSFLYCLRGLGCAVGRLNAPAAA